MLLKKEHLRTATWKTLQEDDVAALYLFFLIKPPKKSWKAFLLGFQTPVHIFGVSHARIWCTVSFLHLSPIINVSLAEDHSTPQSIPMKSLLFPQAVNTLLFYISQSKEWYLLASWTWTCLLLLLCSFGIYKFTSYVGSYAWSSNASQVVNILLKLVETNTGSTSIKINSYCITENVICVFQDNEPMELALKSFPSYRSASGSLCSVLLSHQVLYKEP